MYLPAVEGVVVRHNDHLDLYVSFHVEQLDKARADKEKALRVLVKIAGKVKPLPMYCSMRFCCDLPLCGMSPITGTDSQLPRTARWLARFDGLVGGRAAWRSAAIVLCDVDAWVFFTATSANCI